MNSIQINQFSSPLQIAKNLVPQVRSKISSVVQFVAIKIPETENNLKERAIYYWDHFEFKLAMPRIEIKFREMDLPQSALRMLDKWKRNWMKKCPISQFKIKSIISSTILKRSLRL